MTRARPYIGCAVDTRILFGESPRSIGDSFSPSATADRLRAWRAPFRGECTAEMAAVQEPSHTSAPKMAGAALADAALPASLTPLIGRAEEIVRISRVLRDGSARLLVLTGPGGVGKTRLSLAVAEAVAHDYPDGIALINLGPVRMADQVLPAIAI